MAEPPEKKKQKIEEEPAKPFPNVSDYGDSAQVESRESSAISPSNGASDPPASCNLESYRFTYYHPKLKKFDVTLSSVVTVCIDHVNTNTSKGLPFTESISYSSDKSIGERKYSSKVVQRDGLYKIVTSQAFFKDDFSLMFCTDWNSQWEPPTPVLSMRALVMLTTIGPFLTGLPSESGASEDGSVGGKDDKREDGKITNNAKEDAQTNDSKRGEGWEVVSLGLNN